MKIKRRDLKRLIENYLMIEGISSDAEADAFRLWMAKNYPKYRDSKTGEKLDKVYSGKKSSNNAYVTRAFKKHGKDYERHLKDTADKPSSDTEAPKAAETEEYQTIDKANKATLDKLAAKAEAGTDSGVNTLGIKVWKGLGAAADFLGLDRIGDFLTEGAGIPYHYLALMRFLSAINSKFTVEDREAKRAMQRVCLASLKRQGLSKKPGRKFKVHYVDYGGGQPGATPGNVPKNVPKGYYSGSGFVNGSAADLMLDNVYGQLSVFVGNAIAEVNPDGETFTIRDQYDYNATAIGDLAKAIPTKANKNKVFKNFLGFVLSKAGIGTSDLSAVKALEPVLILLEASSGYPGFPVEIVTVKDEDEASLYQQAKSGIKGALGLDMSKDYIPFLQEARSNRRRKETRVSRSQLRKMILKELYERKN